MCGGKRETKDRCIGYNIVTTILAQSRTVSSKVIRTRVQACHKLVTTL